MKQPETPKIRKPSRAPKKQSDFKAHTKATAKEALDVVDLKLSPKVKWLKTHFDHTEDGALKLVALENLLLAMVKENSCNLEALLSLGFKQKVAEVLIRITKGEATLQDLDEVWWD